MDPGNNISLIPYSVFKALLSEEILSEPTNFTLDIFWRILSRHLLLMGWLDKIVADVFLVFHEGNFKQILMKTLV